MFGLAEMGLGGNRSNALRLWQDPKASLLMVRDGYVASGSVSSLPETALAALCPDCQLSISAFASFLRCCALPETFTLNERVLSVSA